MAFVLKLEREEGSREPCRGGVWGDERRVSKLGEQVGEWTLVERLGRCGNAEVGMAVSGAGSTAGPPTHRQPAANAQRVPSPLDSTLDLDHGEKRSTRPKSTTHLPTMRIRVSNPALTNDLAAYLRRNDCDVVKTSTNVVAVSLSHGLPYDTARFELDFRLADWRLGRPGTTAIVID